MKKGILAVLIMVALALAWGTGVVSDEVKADSKAKKAAVEKKVEETIAVKKAVFLGPGIDCNLCADAIKKAFVETKGVECVHVDVKSKLATFCFHAEETNWKEIQASLGEAGYESKFVKMNDAECPCDDCNESCKHWAKAKDAESCKKKGCPFASQCKKVCK